MEQEICYVKNLTHIQCHHYNREPATVTLEEHDDGKYGICRVLNFPSETSTKS